MNTLETLSLIYNQVLETNDTRLYLFKHSNDNYGLISNTGVEVLPEVIKAGTFKALKSDVRSNKIYVQYTNAETGKIHICEVNAELKCKNIHISNFDKLEHVAKNTLFISSENCGMHVLSKTGKYITEKDYLQLVEFRAFGIIVGVNFLYIEHGNNASNSNSNSNNHVVRSVDILDENGNTQQKDIKKLDIEPFNKVNMQMSELYTRGIHKIDIKENKGKVKVYVDDIGIVRHFT